jgi:hypothetical protein
MQTKLAVAIKDGEQKESRYKSLDGMLERFSSSVITDLALSNFTYAWVVMIQSMIVVGDGVAMCMLFKQHPRGRRLLNTKIRTLMNSRFFKCVHCWAFNELHLS